MLPASLLEVSVIYIIYCADCGYNQEFTDDEVKSMYREYKNGYKKYGLPEDIYCGNCEINNDNVSVCKMIYRSDDINEI